MAMHRSGSLRKVCVLVIWLILLPYEATAVPLSSFYPSSSATDISLPQNLDDSHSGPITLATAFPFFGVSQTTAYVNTNGVVSFAMAVEGYNAASFPLSPTAMLTPFWGDVDTRGVGAGQIRHRQTNDVILLAQARADVLEVYPSFSTFQPTNLLIVTWDHVGHYDSQNFFDGSTNTFQCILITDGTYSFVIFLYADGLIQWSSGDDDSSVHAQAGFNAGDGVRATTISGSQTPEIVNIASTSNIGVPGKYLYRVEDTTIPATPPPAVEVVFALEPANTTVAVNEVTQVKCSAYVSADVSELTLTWSVSATNTPISSDDGLSMYNETLVAGGIRFATTTLIFSGSPLIITHSLACTASVFSFSVSRNFTLSVVEESVELSIAGPENSEIGVEETLTITCSLPSSFSYTPILFVRNGAILDSSNTDDGTHISTGSSESSLTVVNVDHVHGGVYGCIRNSGNSGGVAYAEINVTVREEQPVLDAFTVSDDGVDIDTPNNVLTINGSRLTISCTAHGVPRPILTWTRDGEVIGDDLITRTIPETYTISESVTIESVTAEDSGLYVCEATNRAGSLTSSTQLEVLIPPEVVSSPADSEVEFGHSISLTCVAEGSSLSAFTWTKDNTTLDDEEPHISINTTALTDSSLQSVVQVSSAELGDSGNYSCTASSQTGTSSASFNLLVTKLPVVTSLLSFPSIGGVTLGDDVRIECAATGVPPPSLAWKKDGVDLVNGSSTTVEVPQMFSDGSVFSVLNILSSDIGDDGQYTCNATNHVGSDSMSLNLNLLVPPAIEDSPSDSEVVVSHSISLSCSASGIPSPSISWYGPGETELTNSTSYTITEITGDQSIVSTLVVVAAASRNDSGVFNCTAVNSVGTSSQTFNLLVLEPAEIVGHSENTSVVIGESVAVFCESRGVHTPSVVWTVDGSPVHTNSTVTISESVTGDAVHSTLTIDTAAQSDDGVYSCVASNSAGSDETSFKLTVQVPPAIEDSPSDSEVVVSHSISLSCSASGVPSPSISWYGPGETELTNSTSYTITEVTGDQSIVSTLVVVAAASRNDSGVFNCTAVNSVRTSYQTFNLLVLEPAEIVGHSENTSVVIGESVAVFCESRGVHTPSVVWTVDGSPVHTNSRVTISESATGDTVHSTLTIDTAAQSDDGVYSCVASNSAGSDETSFKLTVQVPPAIEDSPSDSEVVVSHSISLSCSASGVPSPSISWYGPGETELTNSTSYTITEVTGDQSIVSTLVVVAAASRNDSGVFNCTAVNSVGTSYQTFNLLVLEPAEIVGRSENTSVVIGESVAVFCESRGVHTPSVVWTVDGSPVHTNSTVTISESATGDAVHSTLTIDTAAQSDDGVYSCVASNSAGSDETSFKLTVQEPALVVVYPEDTVVLAGDSVLLTCVGYGVPQPSISWERDGETITEDGSKFHRVESALVVEGSVFVRSSLLLCNTSQTDSGNYSCSASNTIREPDTVDFNLTIKTIPPQVLMYPEDVSVAVHSTVSLACTVFGAPPPSVVWTTGLTSTPTTENRLVIRVGSLYMVQSVLHVCGFSLGSVGNYTCSAESYAGATSFTTTLSLEVPANIAVAPNDTSVYVGDSVSLSCVSYGLPLPTVSWTRAGQPLTSLSLHSQLMINETELMTDHVTFVRSTLILCSLQLTDAGQYTCSTSNNHSTSQETFTISVKIEPQIVVFPNNSRFFAGNTIRFSCTGFGLPLPNILWSRNDLDLPIESSTDSRVDIGGETVVIGGHIFVRSHLLICGTVEADSGVYSCAAVTGEREDRVEFEVGVVGVPPSLLHTPVDVDIVAEAGESIVASCIAIGSPAPTITWSLHSHTTHLEPTNTTQSITTPAEGAIHTGQFVESGVGAAYSSLFLCPSHPGLLTTSLISCTASNGVSGDNSTSHSSFLVNVTVEPEVLYEPTHQEKFVRETVSLVCTADGVPPPEIFWLKDNCPLSQTTEHSPRFHVTQSVVPGFRSHVPDAVESVLTIEAISEGDSGAYSCRATNELDTAYSPASHQVTVNDVPVPVDVCGSIAVILCHNGGTCLSRGDSYSCLCRDGWVGAQCEQSDPQLSAPVLVKPPQTVFAELYTDVELECEAVGNPEPVLTWFRDGLEIEGATQKTLVIDEVGISDRAVYHCTAANSQGSVTSDGAYLNILGLAQYRVSVLSGETDLSDVDKWFDVHVERTDISIGGGALATVLCIDSFDHTIEGLWSVFVSLQSVDRVDLTLSRAMEGISSLLNRTSDSLGIHLSLDDITRTDGCPENITTIAFNSMDLDLPWPELPFGRLAEIHCPCDAASLPLTASRRCSGTIGGVVEWAEPDDSQCHFSEMTRILCTIPETGELSLVTDNPEDLGPLEVFLSAVNIQKFSSNTTTGNTSRSDDVLAAIDHLLSAPPEILEESQQQFNTSTLILEGLRGVIDHYPLPEVPPLELRQKSFSAVVDFGFDLDTFPGSSVTFSSSSVVADSGSGLGLAGSGFDDSDSETALSSSVSLSKDLASVLRELEDPRIVYTAFTNEGIFVEREEFVEENNRSSFVVGSVIVVDVRLSGGAVVSDITNVITLMFEKTVEAMENGTVAHCVFWDESFDGGNGGWSERGCRLVSEDEFVATCQCDHLTSFALLVDTAPSEPQKREDRGIGAYVYVGCLVSALFLVLTIFTQLFTRWSTSATGVFLLNTATSLLLLNLCFIAAYYSPGFSDPTCRGVSIVFHFLFLSGVFSFSGLALTKLSGAGKRETRGTLVTKCLVFSGVIASWGLPVLIVALTVIFSDPYNTREFCRPVDDAFHYGLIIPWGLLHLPLYLGLLLAPCPYFSRALREHVQQSWGREFTGTVLSLLLFDIGWGFGLPATHPLNIGRLRFCAQIVFCVASGCVGPAMFIFFSLGRWRERLCCGGVSPTAAGKDWEQQKEEEDERMEKIRVATEKEEVPVITFQYDLDEVYGNPAAMTAEEHYEFESETQFN